MSYADYSPLVQACIALRDCGVLRVNRAASLRFNEALTCGFVVADVFADNTRADLRLSEAGRIWLREIGIDA